MAIAHITAEGFRAMREHGHASYWEVAIYGTDVCPDSVVVECTKCGEVLVELINPDMEDVGDKKLEER